MQALSDYLGLVIPAFEFKLELASMQAPTSKEQLVALLDSGLVQPFQDDVFPSSHACDAVQLWKNHTLNAPILLTTYRMNCEPYLLYNRHMAPKYDPRFVGYGKNRASFHFH